MELMNPPERAAVNWLPFVFGCWAGLGPWIVILCYFLGGGEPSFVASARANKITIRQCGPSA